MNIDKIVELKVVSYTKLKHNDKKNLLNRAKRKTECSVREVKTSSDFESELPNWSLGKKRVFVEVEK